MKNLLLAITCFISSLTIAQLPFLEDFESGSGGFTTSIGQSTDGGQDYFTLTDGSTISATFSSVSGSYFAAQDVDAAPTPGAGGAATLTISNIDITGCSGLSLGIDLAEDDDGTNNDWDAGDFLHITASIDGGAAQNVIWVEGAGGFNTAPFIDTDFDGTGDGAEITSAFQNFTGSIAGAGTTLTITISLSLDSGDEDIAFDNISVTGTGCASCTGVVAEPTNEVSGEAMSNVTCTTADLTWTNGAGSDNTLVVISTSAISGTPTDGNAYTDNATYGSGSTIAAGEYVIYNGAGGNVSIGGLTAGTTYHITLFQYNGALANCEENYLTGGTTLSFTTGTGCTTSDPLIQSIVFNSCGGNANEGIDEIVTFTTGTDPLDVDDIIIYYPPNSSGNNVTFCNTCTSGAGYTVVGGNVNNATYVNDLNTLAGCTVFAYADPIPANSLVMVFTGNPPSTVLDYSSQCGSSNLPVYVIFNDNSSTVGRFSNSATRDLTIDFGNGVSQTVTYNGGALGAEGATALYDENGNVSYFESVNCIFPLPIDMLSFIAYEQENATILKWKTASEINNDYYVIEKSTDGINYQQIGQVQGNGTTSTESSYAFRDVEVNSGVTYYRLKQVDFDGTENYSGTIKLSKRSEGVYYANQKLYSQIENIKANKTYLMNIYNLSGQLVKSYYIDANSVIDWKEKGMFVVEIPELQVNQKITCY